MEEMDELLEEAVSLHRSVAAKHDVIIVEGLLPNHEDQFAGELNAALAQALDAKVIWSVLQTYRIRVKLLKN